jgi:hypothetical protein
MEVPDTVIGTRDGSIGKFHVAAAGGHNTREVPSSS